MNTFMNAYWRKRMRVLVLIIAFSCVSVFVLSPLVRKQLLSKRIAREFEVESQGGMMLHSLKSVDSTDRPIWVVNALWRLATQSSDQRLREHAMAYLGWIKQDPTALTNPGPYDSEAWKDAVNALVSEKSKLRSSKALSSQEFLLLAALEKEGIDRSHQAGSKD